MREIKFRGKRSDGSAWVYGDLCQENSGRKVIMTNLSTWGDNPDDIEPYGENVTVNPDTIGQYTGYKDKDGREIYEGNIIQCSQDKFKKNYEVEYVAASFNIIFILCMEQCDECLNCEVIGNIHDNPELMEGGEK